MRAKIKLKGKDVLIEGIERVSGIGKYLGLMFKRNSSALLFEFSKPCRKGIHSFFCNPFIAVWMLGGQVVECQIVSRWLLFIAPEKDFDKLLEIPLNEKYSHLAGLFVDKPA